MTYVRPSSLGVAEFCPRSADLNERSGISRAAIISTAWHAKLAGNDTLVGELHPDERKEVATYGTPTDTNCEGVPLLWVDAEKEHRVQVWERNDLITEGTLDAVWVVTLRDGRRWAFIGDNKRSTWAIPDGPDCLQLAAYGHGICNERSCVGYTPGLWSGTDSEWTWGRPVDLTDPEALDLYLRLKRASKNDHRLKTKEDDKRYVTGAHCSACYGRQRCPEYAALTAVGPVGEVNEENAAGWLLTAKAMTELATTITENVKVFSERGGVVKDPATGKVYLPTQCQGRMGLDKAAAAAAGVDLSQFEKRGKPYSTFGWRRA